MSSDLLSLVHGRSGHFLYESGHHGDMWFDLETLCLHPLALRAHVSELAARVAPFKPEVVCGPLVEGAYVALLVAQEFGCEFVYANRFTASAKPPTSLFPIQYRIPESLHASVYGRRVVIVNDMISAGSAVGGTFQHLKELEATVLLIASLMLCGDGFASFATEHNVNVESLLQIDSHLWRPEHCPLCAKGTPLESLANA